MSIRTFITCLALLSTTGWAQYVLQDDYLKDGNFFDQMTFFTQGDPTHGSVQYVDRATASKEGLINTNNGQVYMAMDSKNQAPNGRQSVRVTSNKAYNQGLFILDLAKMPGSICSLWPAFWLVGPDWPNNGEIDIIEGVNDGTTNQMTLHTNGGCSISSSPGSMNGDVAVTSCEGNTGCGIKAKNTESFGSGLNGHGGGVYATEWTAKAINVYFWPNSSVPTDITNGKPNPSTWGTPMAIFSGCDLPSHFKNQQIVFDITTCGDWAGKAWASSSCASKAKTCEEFVATKPEEFKDASWIINGLKVYTANGVAPAAVSSSAAVSSTAVVAASATTHAAGNVPGVPLPTTTAQPTTLATVASPATSSAASTATTHSSPTQAPPPTTPLTTTQDRQATKPSTTTTQAPPPPPSPTSSSTTQAPPPPAPTSSSTTQAPPPPPPASSSPSSAQSYSHRPQSTWSGARPSSSSDPDDVVHANGWGTPLYTDWYKNHPPQKRDEEVSLPEVKRDAAEQLGKAFAAAE